MRFLAMAFALCGACRFDPSGIAGETTDLEGSAQDAADPADSGTSGADAPEACDPATNPCCDRGNGDRICVDRQRAGLCNERAFVVERVCPAPSACNADIAPNTPDYVCEFSDGCEGCSTSGDCAGGQVCNAFVTGSSSLLCCADPLIGKGGAYDPCTRGEDCDTGLCVFPTGGGDGQCFAACLSSTCPPGGTCEFPASAIIIDGFPRGLLTCTR